MTGGERPLNPSAAIGTATLTRQSHGGVGNPFDCRNSGLKSLPI
jgi:hypothetical protein